MSGHIKESPSQQQRGFKLNFDGLLGNGNNPAEGLSRLLAVPFSGVDPYEDQSGTPPDKIFDENQNDESQSCEMNFYRVDWDGESRLDCNKQRNLCLSLNKTLNI